MKSYINDVRNYSEPSDLDIGSAPESVREYIDNLLDHIEYCEAEMFKALSDLTRVEAICSGLEEKLKASIIK